MTTTHSDTFTVPCTDCGTTVHVVGGSVQAHACEAPEDQRSLVARAYWQGHDAAAAISPEAFMAQPAEPDEDADGPQIPQALLDEISNPPSALDSIAESLARLVEHFEGTGGVGETHAVRDDYVQVQREELADLHAAHLTLRALLEEIETIIKPSTSKLANQVRAAIKAWRDPEVPAEPLDEEHTDPDGGQLVHPAHDAPVEEWRAFARHLGHGRTGPAFNDLTTMNRSQIRTALGIPQPEDGA